MIRIKPSKAISSIWLSESAPPIIVSVFVVDVVMFAGVVALEENMKSVA